MAIYASFTVRYPDRPQRIDLENRRLGNPSLALRSKHLATQIIHLLGAAQGSLQPLPVKINKQRSSP